MKILFIINNSINYGGAERYVSTLANGLAKAGHNIVVVSSGGPLVNYLNKDIAQEIIEPILTASPEDLTKMAQFIKASSRKYKIDLIHCNSLVDFNAASLVNKMTDIPIVYTAHLTEERAGFPIIGAKLNGNATKVIAVSNFIKNHLKKTGLPSTKIELVYHGVDIHKFKENKLKLNIKHSLGIKNGERIIMCVARLYPVKGIDRLIKAIPVILERGNIIKVVLVGNGAHKKEYEKLAHSLGVKSKVLFLGVQENVEALLNAADVFCLSSVTESLSFAILEAMAVGKPVVATKVGGVPEVVVNEITGLLVSPGNTRQLAYAINRLVEDKPLAKTLGENARNRIKEIFSFDRMIKETLSVYEQVLEENKVYA